MGRHRPGEQDQASRSDRRDAGRDHEGPAEHDRPVPEASPIGRPPRARRRPPVAQRDDSIGGVVRQIGRSSRQAPTIVRLKRSLVHHRPPAHRADSRRLGDRPSVSCGPLQWLPCSQRRHLGAVTPQGRHPRLCRTAARRRPRTGGRRRCIVQIDGLGLPVLRRAIAEGPAPFLGSLIERGEAMLGPWAAMLPPTTPASQAGIMHGHNDEVPGFRWYEKKEKRLLVANHAGDARRTRPSRGRGSPGTMATAAGWVAP